MLNTNACDVGFGTAARVGRDDDEVVAADAVFNVDEDAMFRQPELEELEEDAGGETVEA